MLLSFQHKQTLSSKLSLRLIWLFSPIVMWLSCRNYILLSQLCYTFVLECYPGICNLKELPYLSTFLFDIITISSCDNLSLERYKTDQKDVLRCCSKFDACHYVSCNNYFGKYTFSLMIREPLHGVEPHYRQICFAWGKRRKLVTYKKKTNKKKLALQQF